MVGTYFSHFSFPSYFQRNKLKQVTNLLLDDSAGDIVQETRARISQIASTVDLNTPILYSGNHSKNKIMYSSFCSAFYASHKIEGKCHKLSK